MEIGQKFGMQTMNAELFKLYKKKLISKKDAMTRSPEPEQMVKMMEAG
jgi:Tfp pilus assembly pilus retraction ATPase PilT